MENLIEKASKIKVIFFDIDDTLRVKDTGIMPKSVNRVFEALREKGILTGIATGRNFFGVIPEIRALKPDFFVTANGSHVEDKAGNFIYDQPLPQAVVTDLVEWLRSTDEAYVFYGANEVIASNDDAITRNALDSIYGKMPVDKDYFLKAPVYQLLSVSEHDERLVLPDNLTDKVRMVRWHKNSSDIVPMTGSKAIGVSHVLDKLGLTAENLMTFGDELNDIELFDYAGLAVAMKVSHPTILEKADYVTDSVENDGIEKALKILGIL
ncbi:hydrolase [Lactococcus hodotermopsidis]|uniref:Hydrolase n=1 Tax=Pseudolactococcus hodotermopsidis TaxID=2709157 RepID=A0A6A0BEN9_9LACT|nr:hydrolase [Lactococcus hodotermopsidis]